LLLLLDCGKEVDSGICVPGACDSPELDTLKTKATKRNKALR